MEVVYRFFGGRKYFIAMLIYITGVVVLYTKPEYFEMNKWTNWFAFSNPLDLLHKSSFKILNNKVDDTYQEN